MENEIFVVDTHEQREEIYRKILLGRDKKKREKLQILVLERNERPREKERERESRLDDDLGNEINELTGLRVSS